MAIESTRQFSSGAASAFYPSARLHWREFCEMMALEMNSSLCTTQPALLAAFASGFLLLFPLQSPAEQRVFTNTKGQEIIAEIVSAKGDSVVLNKDGREIETSISIYSPEDQTYIRKWMQENPAAIDYNLVIAASKKKIGRISAPAGYYERRESTWGYDITVENRSRDTASGLTLEYRIFKESNVRDEGYPRTPREIEEKKGSIKIPDLVTNRSLAIATETFTLLEINYYSTNDYVDKLMGILLRIVDSDGKTVAEFKGGSQEIMQKEWENKPTQSSSVIIK